MATHEIRCSGCARLLFKTDGADFGCKISIKCPRCRAFNHLRPQTSPSPKRPDRDGKDPLCGSSYPRTT
ncbi:Com family DNA-binding transcriptional regulator [Loktanella sp. TSTF-M6]|uniref:Com family DNA-binding transcriptional regulator n=1 Tax=Loktanella gaetbuli TaxID=2881335 RepID=A0ABS8BSC1_9RHOB|nr:Com family DNA-binding transcriptional regulator [Loktanella gaetbuli]